MFVLCVCVVSLCCEFVVRVRVVSVLIVVLCVLWFRSVRAVVCFVFAL